jgi:hypothetical protein
MDALFSEEGKRFVSKTPVQRRDCQFVWVLTTLSSDAGTSILVAGIDDLPQIGCGEPEMSADEGAGDDSLAGFAA